MCLFNKHAGDGRQGLSEGIEFMERTTPWDASGIIADNTSRTTQTARFNSQVGALPGKLTVEHQFFLVLFMINTAHKGKGNKLLIFIFQFKAVFRHLHLTKTFYFIFTLYAQMGLVTTFACFVS